MEAIKVEHVVEEDGRIVLTGLPVQRGETVDVTIRAHRRKRARKPMTIGELLESELIGIWADRDDIGDSLEYARRLRERAEKRDWTTDDPS